MYGSAVQEGATAMRDITCCLFHIAAGVARTTARMGGIYLMLMPRRTTISARDSASARPAAAAMQRLRKRRRRRCFMVIWPVSLRPLPCIVHTSGEGPAYTIDGSAMLCRPHALFLQRRLYVISRFDFIRTHADGRLHEFYITQHDNINFLMRALLHFIRLISLYL